MGLRFPAYTRSQLLLCSRYCSHPHRSSCHRRTLRRRQRESARHHRSSCRRRPRRSVRARTVGCSHPPRPRCHRRRARRLLLRRYHTRFLGRLRPPLGKRTRARRDRCRCNRHPTRPGRRRLHIVRCRPTHHRRSGRPGICCLPAGIPNLSRRSRRRCSRRRSWCSRRRTPRPCRADRLRRPRAGRSPHPGLGKQIQFRSRTTSSNHRRFCRRHRRIVRGSPRSNRRTQQAGASRLPGSRSLRPSCPSCQNRRRRDRSARPRSNFHFFRQLLFRPTGCRTAEYSYKPPRHQR